MTALDFLCKVSNPHQSPGAAINLQKLIRNIDGKISADCQTECLSRHVAINQQQEQRCRRERGHDRRKGFACYRWAFCTSICEGKMSREISTPENFSAKLSLIGIILAWWKSFRTRVLVPPKNSRKLWLTLVPAVLGSALVFEARTSQFEARALSALSAQLSYRTGPGPSSNISFPSSGPFNEIRGYAELSEFVLRLKDAGFHITEQARLSPAL